MTKVKLAFALLLTQTQFRFAQFRLKSKTWRRLRMGFEFGAFGASQKEEIQFT